MLMPPGQMQPQEPYQPMPQPGQNPYGFIMEPPEQPKRPLVPGQGSSMRQRVAVVGVGAAVLIIVIIILASVIFGGKSSNPDLVGLAAQETELARVAALGEAQASSATAKNLAITADLDLTSTQKQLVSYLAKRGQSVGQKQLSADKNLKSDQVLTAAQTTGNFDSAFMSLMQTNLTAYQSSVRQAFDATTNQTARTILNNSYTEAGLLLQITKQPL